MADNRTEQIDFERVWGEVVKTAHLMIHKFRIYGYEYEDLLQEARIECWKSLQDFDPNHNVKFNTYYFVRLKNRFRKLYQDSIRKKDYYNQHRNSKLNDDLILKFVESEYKTPEDVIIEEEKYQTLQKIMKLLPHPILRPIKLKAKGYETKEIAKRMGVSVPTINKRFKAVRQMIEKNDVEYAKAWIQEWKKNQSKKPLKIKDPS